MEKFKFILLVVLLLFIKDAFSQNANHPTISNLTVQYKSLPQHTLSVSQPTNSVIKVIAMATISLVDASLVSSLNFKIINNTGAIEYESNYTKTSNTISDANGRKIFQINGNSILINVPRELPSGNYSFYVYTKSAANISSPTYTLTY